jgi:hypothetical protein
LRLLQRAIDQGFFGYPYFSADPLLAGVRGEPVYLTIVERARKRHEAFRATFS